MVVLIAFTFCLAIHILTCTQLSFDGINRYVRAVQVSNAALAKHCTYVPSRLYRLVTGDEQQSKLIQVLVHTLYAHGTRTTDFFCMAVTMQTIGLCTDLDSRYMCIEAAAWSSSSTTWCKIPAWLYACTCHEPLTANILEVFPPLIPPANGTHMHTRTDTYAIRLSI